MPERVGFQGIRTLSWRMTKTQTIWLAGGINVDSLSFFYPETIISANSLRGSGLWINYNPNRVPCATPKTVFRWQTPNNRASWREENERFINWQMDGHSLKISDVSCFKPKSWLLSVLFINLSANDFFRFLRVLSCWRYALNFEELTRYEFCTVFSIIRSTRNLSD